MKIKLYTLATCHTCKELRRQLQEEGVEFEEVAAHREVMETARDLHFTRVPFAVIDVAGKIEAVSGVENILDSIRTIGGE